MEKINKRIKCCCVNLLHKSNFLLSIIFIIIFQILFLNSNICAMQLNLGDGKSLEISYKAIKIIDLNTGKIILAQDNEKVMYPASTTKIMTYIITIESIKDIDATKIKVKNAVLDQLAIVGQGSTMMGIYDGEEFSVRQLLHGLMLSSGNDAALVLADYLGNNDVKLFVEKMNQKAIELGCICTNFENPHGLFEDSHYSTADDLEKITLYAMGLPEFINITSMVTSNILGNDRILTTTNRLINPTRDGGKYYYKYAKGIKTGLTAKSGFSLISTAEKNGQKYLCIALDSPCVFDAMIDSKNIYEWAFEHAK